MALTTEHIGNGSDEHLYILFEELFSIHEKAMHSIAFKVTKSHQTANDIVQEVFIKLWEHRSEIAGIQNMEAWLTRIIKNKLIDFLRKAAADDRLRTKLWEEIDSRQQATERKLEAKESEYIIKQAVEQMPSQRKLVFRLNRENNMSYQEIADKLSISRHTVKNQLSSALRFLQKKISFE